MPNDFKVSVVVDRPIEDVFAFLADGENDPKFSPRVLEMAKTTPGPPAVGTRYASTVKDAGMKTKREFEYTEFVAPTKIRWTERSKNVVTATEGGYDLAPEGTGTRVTLYNVLEGHGVIHGVVRRIVRDHLRRVVRLRSERGIQFEARRPCPRVRPH